MISMSISIPLSIDLWTKTAIFFTIQIPYDRKLQFTIIRFSSPPPLKGDRRMAKEILIADSDQADQEEFQKIFETTDYHLIFSESGEDALLRVKLFTPDMIIASGAGLCEMGGLA